MKQLLSVAFAGAGFAGLAGQAGWRVAASVFLIYVSAILFVVWVAEGASRTGD